MVVEASDEFDVIQDVAVREAGPGLRRLEVYEIQHDRHFACESTGLRVFGNYRGPWLMLEGPLEVVQGLAHIGGLELPLVIYQREAGKAGAITSDQAGPPPFRLMDSSEPYSNTNPGAGRDHAERVNRMVAVAPVL